MPKVLRTPSRFLYRTSWGSLLAGALLAGGCAAGVAYVAQHTPETTSIENAPFRVEHARTLFWAVAGFAGLFSALALLTLVLRLVRESYLVVEADSIRVPSGWLITRDVELAYAEIQSFREATVDGSATIILIGPKRKCAITAAKFPNLEDYESLRRHLEQRLAWAAR